MARSRRSNTTSKCTALTSLVARLILFFLGLLSHQTRTALCYSIRLPPKPIPITVLSGFLGSGKTTLLQNLLQNKQGLRIAVIVNDVASVNIDSKLVANTRNSNNDDNDDDNGGGYQAPAGMVELQNGCACCSQAEELLASVAELVTLSDLRGEGGDDDEGAFDHIVIECSGVADPKGVRAQFQQAALYQMPLLERVTLDTMVTLVDAASYLEYLESDKIASPDETPELYYPDGQVPPDDNDYDDEWDGDENIPEGLRALLGRNNNNQPASTEESVAALLMSQTETADVILLNKCDLVTPERLQQIEAFVRACAPSAAAAAETRIQRCTYAKVDWKDILAVAGGQGVALSGIIDDHREAVQNAAKQAASIEVVAAPCSDPECTEDHEHSHDHSNGAAATTEKTDHQHDHSHQHSHEHDDVSEGHSHSHIHDHDAASCDDPNCTDPTHNHGATHAGIATLVYQARRPFHPGRLLTFLRKLPISMGLPEEASSAQSSAPTDPVMSKIVRSKGFCWFADSNHVAYYWSQAGPSFELSKAGAWWATLPRERWPSSAVESILVDFDDRSHDDKDSFGKSVGDRRQEIVFIGSSLGSRKNQAIVNECLDQCLLQDDEWEEFRKEQSNESALRSKFPTPFVSRLTTY